MLKKPDHTAFDLSRDFRDKAETADALSYRVVRMDITYHVPSFPHLLETRPHQIYDRLDIGLEDLVVTRAIIENPAMAGYLLPYLAMRPTPQPVKGDMEAIKFRTRDIFNVMAGVQAREDERRYLIARTDAEMDLRLDYLKDVRESFTVDFGPAQAVDHLARLEAMPETKFLPGLKHYFSNWMFKPVANITHPEDEPAPRQAQAPLNIVAVALGRIVQEETLRKARLFVDDTLNEGRRIITAAPTISNFILR